MDFAHWAVEGRSAKNMSQSKSRRRAIALFERRQFLRGAMGAASLLVAPAFMRSARGDTWSEGTGLFPLGVASGDPTHDSVVLWTRLSDDPLAAESLREAVPLAVEVAEDPGMRRVIRRGLAVARADSGYAVRVTVAELPPDRWLYYRFTAQGRYRGHASRVGRTRTFPHPDPRHRSRGVRHAEHCRIEEMRFAVASCQHFGQGFYPAWRDIAAQDLDFVVHTGDYIYESGAASTPLLAGRDHVGGELLSVGDYRRRYAQYRLDPNLQNAHAQCPFIVTWDDHEVDNNYAGDDAEEGAPFQGEAFLERRGNAYQVYAESMPLRLPARRSPEEQLRVFRRLQFGGLADVHMLDTRQYRTDQPAADGFGSTAEVDPVTAAFLEQVLGEPLFDADGILDSDASLLGGVQEAWLATNLARSQAKWNVLAQQVMLMPWNLRETGKLFVQFGPDFPNKPQALAAIGSLQNILNVDAWDGYSRARDRLFRMLDRLRPASPVVLTGDIHSAWAAELLEDFGDPQNSDVLAVEIVCTSISSTFLAPDPRPTDQLVRASLPANPHIRYFNGAFRGYCVCEVDANRWRTQFRAVGDPADLGDASPVALLPLESDNVFTDATAVIERGFNRRGERGTLAVQGVVTGAA
jgi:alkaline phosphatase D